MAKGFMEKLDDPKWLATKVSLQRNWGGSLWFLGFIFAILGIIADVTGTLGLTMMAWFMLAIVFHLAGLSYWIGYALAIYLKAKS